MIATFIYFVIWRKKDAFFHILLNCSELCGCKSIKIKTSSETWSESKMTITVKKLSLCDSAVKHIKHTMNQKGLNESILSILKHKRMWWNRSFKTSLTKENWKMCLHFECCLLFKYEILFFFLLSPTRTKYCLAKVSIVDFHKLCKIQMIYFFVFSKGSRP